MKIKSVLSAVAVAGLVVAPVAAQAGTAAANSIVSERGLSSVAKRNATKVKANESLSGGLLIAAVLAGGAAVYGLTQVLDDDDKSDGAS